MTNRKNDNNRCKGRTMAGKPCRAAATEGGLCFFHGSPKKAAELGRIGGRKNRRSPADTSGALPKLDNALAVRDTVARLIEDTYSGRLNPRIGAGLAPLLSLQLRTIQIADHELRLKALELERERADDIPLRADASRGATEEPPVDSDATPDGSDDPESE